MFSNRKNILEELDNFEEKLSEFKELIKSKDEKTLLKKMKLYEKLYWKVLENSK